jgi:tetratricopeptide (TPR) repeat protein
MSETLSWLNRFESTHLRRTTQALLRHINDPSTPEEKKRQVIETALQHSRDNFDPLELPELMLNLAGFYTNRQDYSAAMEFALQALPQYPEGSHARGVTQWILGEIAWKSVANFLAFSSWYQAREIFEVLAQQEEISEKTVTSQWYGDLLTQINVKMIGKPEEIYTWLDLFDPSRLSEAAVQLVNEITEKINQEWLTESDSQEITGLVDDLHSLGLNSVDPLESAEVLVECAMVFCRLDNLSKAQEMQQKAVEIFPPQSHQRAVTLWLLGIFQWLMPVRRKDAISSWEECLDMMADLIQIYQQEDKPDRVTWYRQKRDTMSRMLDEKTAEIQDL